MKIAFCHFSERSVWKRDRHVSMRESFPNPQIVMTIDPVSQAIITNLTKLALETGWKQLGQKPDRQLQQ